MYKIAKPLFFRTETPMHVGSGSDLGHIDLPIQREKHTDFPMVQSSSLKGAFREHIEQNVVTEAEEIGIHLTFGYDDDGVEKGVKSFFENREHQDYSGALAFTDARILLFPVKSYKGVYALITCPQVLDKLYQELAFICNLDRTKIDKFSGGLSFNGDNAIVANSDYLGISGKVILDEYIFNINETESNQNLISELAAQLSDFLGNQILDRLVLLPNDIFQDFTKLSTEVITRTKIQNDTGTVQSGALFTEEYLPAESYLYTLVAAHRIFQKRKKGNEDNEYDLRQAKFPRNKDNNAIKTANDVIAFFQTHLKDIAQIGGSSTLGKGIVKLFKNQLTNGD